MIHPYLEAGKLVTTHGVRGELKLEVYCDSAELLKNVKTLYGGPDGEKPMAVASLRGVGRMAIVQFCGVDTIDAARRLAGRVVYFSRGDVSLSDGRCFIQDLIGCEVRDANTGKVYGTVKSVDHPGPQDIYTVASPDGREYLFPGVPEFLRKADPEEGYLLVTPIPGLLDDDTVEDTRIQGEQ